MSAEFPGPPWATDRTDVGTLKITMAAALFGGGTEIGCDPQNPVVSCPAPSNAPSVNVVNSP
ncbi:hypothetical protein [Streptomyces sp. NBC_01294]|uniref:hypothetical protein n=1 Tax=Streptomyces sp. NBC_01294 TaxID=2903815 RepID=UPI002DDA028B|nr:hypothetical protein [Streptomyces sp. NBC_01294]WRZ58766.1 hypothetical protein OG534_21070 [Streptomyces sp. NBC_01294]